MPTAKAPRAKKPEVKKLSTRILGKTGFKATEIGFGAWGIGKSMWGKTDDAESRKALRRALDLGINFFDTAYVYGHGHSEKLIGEALREAGKKALVATKVPPKNMEWPAHPRSLIASVFPPEWIRSCAETSLRNLRMDAVDLLQFHVWTDAWLKDKCWPESVEMIETLKKAGKIRAIGVSINSGDPSSALEIVRSGVIDTVQVIFNLFEQQPLDKLFPLCEQKNVGIIVRCPFDEGGLTGKLTPQTRFEPEDFRSHYFGGDRLPETCRRAKELENLLVNGHAPNLAQAALKFCLSFSSVSTIIPGMRKVEHVEDNVRAADGRYFDQGLLNQLQAHAWIRHFYN